MRLAKTPRSAATTVEFAVVVPVTLLILFGIIVGALGVFRYQEVAALAREGARYASVRGTRYNLRTGYPMATPADVLEKAIKPRATLVDANKLEVTVTWDPDKRPGSMVTVTVKYVWIPEAVFGTVTLTSSATQTMSY